jgi:AcrR family transcriptional regulator
MTESRRAKPVNTTKDKKVGVGRPRDLSADESILRAAIDLFSEYGIEGASIEQIARRAGVARTTIYRRWLSREDLLVHAIEHGRNFPEQSMEGLEKMQPDELLNLAVKAGIDALTRPQFRKLAARLIGSSMSHPALMSVYQTTYLQPRRRAFAKVLKIARAQGLLPSNTDVEILFDMLTGAMLYHLLLQPEEHDDEKIRVYLLKLFEQAGWRIRDQKPKRRSGTRQSEQSS